MNDRKRYAIVGTGGRCTMFTNAICGKYADHAALVGLCDVSPTRMAWHNDRLAREFNVEPIPTYTSDQFDRMIDERKPDTVIVTTVDAVHHEYIIRAMELGCDAISEKPMTIDAEKARTVLDAVERTGRSLRVTFNYRYQAMSTKFRELVQTGAVGEPKLVDFQWTLDTSHGADYYRRWHREKDKSGGLLVHKATHHFDLVNWWIDSYPKTVFAMGELMFYGKANAARRGERYPYERYTGVAEAKDDPFALDLTSREGLKGLYLEAEADSGYLRDRNVFGEPITIEDTHAVTARYRNGAILNYSLVAYSPWEGLRVAITGDKGRIELFDRHGSHIIEGQSDEQLAAAQARVKEQSIRVFPMFGVPYDVEIPEAKGGHGGGDAAIVDRIFNPDAGEDPFGRDATHVDGAASILLGVAAEQSIATGEPVDVDELLTLPG